MFGQKSKLVPDSKLIFESPFTLTQQNTLLFLTGAPLSGKSTIAPYISSAIESCSLQPMDIMRLVSQMIQQEKPAHERNPFVYLGSCECYELIGDGTYTKESLIEGYNKYSEAIFGPAAWMFPKFETQGEHNVLFEGVQITPRLVRDYLNHKNKLIIITSNEKQLRENTIRLYGEEPNLLDRYSTDKLLAIQEELIKQTSVLKKDDFLIVENTGDYKKPVKEIFEFLLSNNVVKLKE